MKTRRDFLTSVAGTSALLTFGGVAPEVLCQAADTSDDAKGRVLVVVQLTGGNDGLNTVVPFGNDDYRKARKTLAIGADDVLKIDKDYGFHPEMRGFAELLEAGELSIVPSVGYTNPNRSHFESMDIWHTCQRKAKRRETGWLGHYLESATGKEKGLAGLHIGNKKQPLAMAARDLRVPSIESLERFRLEKTGNEKLDQVIEATVRKSDRSEGNDLLGFMKSSTRSAVAANERLNRLGKTKSNEGFPETSLGRKLSTVSRLIKANLPTRVYYVTLDGFDTHARQANAHGSLLRQFSDAVTALIKDLRTAGQSERVLVMGFSEFGRRIAENASEGTDHGTAGPLFLAGGKLKSGFVGAHSNFADKKDGDLTFRTDFRQVYTTVLRNWFDCQNTTEIIGGKFQSLPFIA